MTTKTSLIKKCLVSLISATSLVGITASFADTQAKRTPLSTQAPASKEHPVMSFPGKSKGLEAFKRLKASGKLSQWAAYYDLEENEVQRIFETDPSANLDLNGRLHYIEAASTATGNFPAAQTGIPLDQTFFLNSSPRSSKTIYLDFNGHSTTNTAWNTSYNLTTIASPAYDIDNIPGSFSSTELNNIQAIWKMVAEDYAGLDVNITTEEPPADRLVRSSNTDNVYGVRVVITRDFTASTSQPCSCGGFAYVGVFSDKTETYKPAFVFYNQLGSAKNIAEASSHEAGHTLGLSHDGTSTSGYYAGHGTGETGWAPIMGVGYNKNLVQWSKGEYANANQKQDDYLVMQGRGVPFDVDEHGNTIGNATALVGSVVNGLNEYRAAGILQGPTDTDYVSFVANAGSFRADLQPLSATMGNLDILASLLDAQGNVLAQSNSETTLATLLQFDLPVQGTYFLKVEGTGKGDPLTTGYTRYGSTGYWSALIKAQAVIGNQAPTARISSDKTTGTAPLAVTFSAASSSDPEGSPLTYNWDFADGTVATGVQVSKVYQAAGTFPVSVLVTDTAGLTGSASISINVTATVTQISMAVASISMAGVVQKNQRYANATVTVKDQNGSVVPGVVVNGSWSGAVSGSATGTTGNDGTVVLKSPLSKARTPTFVFTVTSASKAGHVYDSSKNTLSQNSITLQ